MEREQFIKALNQFENTAIARFQSLEREVRRITVDNNLDKKYQITREALLAAFNADHATASYSAADITNMEYIGFKTIQQAAEHKRQHGGWVFVSNAGVRIVWFAHHYTVSQIMLHDITRGFNGAVL